MAVFGRTAPLDNRHLAGRPVRVLMRRGTAGSARLARALAVPALCVLAAPIYAQGAGPPDLGAAGYVILGVWLGFWIGVFVYPIALVIYLIQRQSDARAAEQNDEFVAPARGVAIFKKAIISHLVLTVAALILFLN